MHKSGTVLFTTKDKFTALNRAQHGWRVEEMTSREQFEAWYLESWGHTEDDHATLFERGPDGDEYYRLGVRMAHEAWQAASKASEQHLAAVVAENAGLKVKGREVLKEAAYVYSHYNRMVDHLDGESIDGQTLHEFQAVIEAETPATDAYLAEVRAQGVEMYAVTLDRGADDAERDGFDDGMKFLRAEAEGVRKFATQLRKGVAK